MGERFEAGTSRPAWSAVYALALGVAVLTAAEMLPISLLTPIANSLHITEGLTGQAVTATAIAALVSSLLVAVVAGRLDRRTLLLALSVLEVASCVVSASATNVGVLMVGQMLVGVALGGFWALSASLAVRLVPADAVPRALAIIFGGVSVATCTAGPLGSFLGDLIGWRGVFLVTAAVAGADLAWQFMALPGMPSPGRAKLSGLVDVMRRPRMKTGMLAVVLVFAGHFAFFTYLRPFIEGVGQLRGPALSLTLLAFGLGNFAGTWASGRMLSADLRTTLLSMPVLMAVLAWVLVTLGAHPLVAAASIALWGFAFGTVPVGWSTWLTQTVPDQAESGGGVLVATIQVAITLGAAVGGMLFDAHGVLGSFVGSGLLLLATAVVVLIGFGPRRSSLPSVATSTR